MPHAARSPTHISHPPSLFVKTSRLPLDVDVTRTRRPCATWSRDGTRSPSSARRRCCGAPATVSPLVRAKWPQKRPEYVGTTFALGWGVRNRLLALVLLTATACSPAQRAAAGVGMGVVGAGVTYGAIEWMVPRCTGRSEQGQGCVQHPEPLPPEIGFPVVLGGIGVVVLGGLILATAGEHHGRSTKDVSTTETPPEAPAPLDQTEAVGMAVAEYMLVGLHRNAKPSKLLDVDDTQVTLQANERYAELLNLRIRVGSDESWRVVGACYEYEHAWRLTAVGTTLECPR